MAFCFFFPASASFLIVDCRKADLVFLSNNKPSFSSKGTCCSYYNITNLCSMDTSVSGMSKCWTHSIVGYCVKMFLLPYPIILCPNVEIHVSLHSYHVALCIACLFSCQSN